MDAELLVDIAELMVSPDSDIVSAGVPTDLRVNKICSVNILRKRLIFRQTEIGLKNS